MFFMKMERLNLTLIERRLGTSASGGSADYASIFVDAGENAVALGATLDSTPTWAELGLGVGTDVKSFLLSGAVAGKRWRY